jgi:hypothetical protein
VSVTLSTWSFDRNTPVLSSSSARGEQLSYLLLLTDAQGWYLNLGADDDNKGGNRQFMRFVPRVSTSSSTTKTAREPTSIPSNDNCNFSYDVGPYDIEGEWKRIEHIACYGPMVYHCYVPARPRVVLSSIKEEVFHSCDRLVMIFHDKSTDMVYEKQKEVTKTLHKYFVRELLLTPHERGTLQWAVPSEISGWVLPQEAHCGAFVYLKDIGQLWYAIDEMPNFPSSLLLPSPHYFPFWKTMYM